MPMATKVGRKAETNRAFVKVKKAKLGVCNLRTDAGSGKINDWINVRPPKPHRAKWIRLNVNSKLSASLRLLLKHRVLLVLCNLSQRPRSSETDLCHWNHAPAIAVSKIATQCGFCRLANASWLPVKLRAYLPCKGKFLTVTLCSASPQNLSTRRQTLPTAKWIPTYFCAMPLNYWRFTSHIAQLQGLSHAVITLLSCWRQAKVVSKCNCFHV